jgi:glucokinase
MKEKYFIGLDVGATKIAAGLVTRRGKIIKKEIFKTQVQKGKRIILKNIIRAAESVWSPKVSAVGIGMAGQCNFKTGIFLSGPNFPKNFKNIKIKKILENKFKVPASLDNDAHCFTLAESILGAGKNYNDIIGITIGTGIGGGILINKKIYRGKNNTAGEIGHITIDASSPFVCSCGRLGHFEALCSGRAMINFYKRLTGKTKTTFEIQKLAKGGDKEAQKVNSLLSKYLGLGLTNIIHIFNPEIIIIGGGLAKIKELWRPALRKIKRGVIYNSLKQTKILKSKLPEDAGILGAALLCLKIGN